MLGIEQRAARLEEMNRRWAAYVFRNFFSTVFIQPRQVAVKLVVLRFPSVGHFAIVEAARSRFRVRSGQRNRCLRAFRADSIPRTGHRLAVFSVSVTIPELLLASSSSCAMPHMAARAYRRPCVIAEPTACRSTAVWNPSPVSSRATWRFNTDESH